MVAALCDSESIGLLRTRNAVATGDRLFDLQLAFNLFPATYAHRSWIPPLVADVGLPQPPADLTPFWTRRLSSALLRAWRLDVQFDCDFFDPAKRFALIDAPALIRIGGLAGAVLMQERLRHVVDRVEVEALRRGIGLEAQRFALKWTDTPRELARHVRTWMLPSNGPLPDQETWAMHAAALIVAAMPATAPGVLGRLQFRFPRSWSQVPAGRARLPEVLRASLVALLIQIVRADADGWRWLFEPTLTRPLPC